MIDGSDPDVSGQDSGGSIARRELIRRGIAAGSLVWATPAITGFSRAYAQQSPPPDGGGDPGPLPPAGTCATITGTSSPDTAFSPSLPSTGQFVLANRAREECATICSAGTCPPGFRCATRLEFVTFIGFCTPEGQGHICTSPGVPCDCQCRPV